MSGRQVIGVDAGGTKLLTGVVDEGWTVHHRGRRLWRGGGCEEVLDTIADAVEEALRAAPRAEAVGFGIPSLVDVGRGVSLSSVHLPLDGVPFRDLMADRLGLPVWVDNDATAAVVAEHRQGAAKGKHDVVLLTLGTGVGGGLLLDGRVYRGSLGAAGELGHIVVDEGGPRCFGGCPGRGCLESLVSGSALARDGRLAAIGAAGKRPGSTAGSAGSAPGSTPPPAASADSALGRVLAEGREMTGVIVTEAALAGDPLARDVVHRAGRSLGAGITGIVNAFNPEVVIVGGGVMALGELLLAPAREVVAERALPPSREGVEIVPAALAEESGMLGAAQLALDLAGAGAVPEEARPS